MVPEVIVQRACLRVRPFYDYDDHICSSLHFAVGFSTEKTQNFIFSDRASIAVLYEYVQVPQYFVQYSFCKGYVAQVVN